LKALIYRVCFRKAHNKTLSLKCVLAGEYYYEVLKTIEEANKSIHIAMFLMKYDADDSFDWANDLIKALNQSKEERDEHLRSLGELY